MPSVAPIARWVSFGVFLLFALIAPYISRLLFGILVSVRFRGHRILWLQRLEELLQRPFTGLLALAFLWLAVSVPFRDFWDRSESSTAIAALDSLVRVLFRLAFSINAIWATSRFSRFLVFLTQALLGAYRVPPLYQPGMLEGMRLAAVILTLALAVFLLVDFVPGSGRGASSSLLLLLASPNWLTMSIIVGVTPVFRDILAGLSLYRNEMVQADSLFRLVDVSPIGQVKEFRLRITVLEALDKSLHYIPNSKFLRFPLISYSNAQQQVYVCQVEVPLSRLARAAQLRALVNDLQASLRALARQGSSFAPLELVRPAGVRVTELPRSKPSSSLQAQPLQSKPSSSPRAQYQQSPHLNSASAHRQPGATPTKACAAPADAGSAAPVVVAAAAVDSQEPPIIENPDPAPRPRKASTDFGGGHDKGCAAASRANKGGAGSMADSENCGRDQGAPEGEPCNQAEAFASEPARGGDAVHSWQVAIADPEGFTVAIDADSRLVIAMHLWEPGDVPALKRLQSETLLFLTAALERHEIQVRGASLVTHRSLDVRRAPQRDYTD